MRNRRDFFAEIIFDFGTQEKLTADISVFGQFINHLNYNQAAVEEMSKSDNMIMINQTHVLLQKDGVKKSFYLGINKRDLVALFKPITPRR